MSKTPKYLKRVVPPLSDGRTPGVCKYCGRQHPPAEPSWDSSDRGCEAKDDTQGDRLARELIEVAERAAKKAALWEEIADQRENELATLRAQRDELWEQLTPLKDAVLFARSQRRPMGIGQDFPRTEAQVRLGIGIEYGRERDNAGFWIDSDELGPQEADSPDPTKRIALALIRLAYSVAEKVKPRP